jgi:hypothetical protein
MKPEHEQRRKIIREWMSLSKEKRQTQDQADAFATKAKSGSIQSQRRTTQAARRAGGRVKSGVCAATAIWNSP